MMSSPEHKDAQQQEGESREGYVAFVTLSRKDDVIWVRWRLNGGWSLDDEEDATWTLQYEGAALPLFSAETDANGHMRPLDLKLSSTWRYGERSALEARQIEPHVYQVSFVELFVNHFAEIRMAYDMTIHLKNRRVTVHKTVAKERH